MLFDSELAHRSPGADVADSSDLRNEDDMVSEVGFLKGDDWH